MDALPQDIPALPPTEMSDLQLGEHFKAWGSCSKAAMRRALSLLPEIAARGIHRKEGFQSLREYAAKLAGASAGVVEEVMRLHRAIGHLPELWGLLATGQAGWSILRTFAPIANPENAAELATLATRLSRREAQDYVKSLDPTRISAASSKLANNSCYSEKKTLLCLRPHHERLLRDMQDQYSRVRGEGISMGELVGLLLEKAWDNGLQVVESPHSEKEPIQSDQPVVVRKVLEVVVRVAETGERFMRGVAGLLALGPGLLPAGSTQAHTVWLSDLYKRAVTVAAQARRRTLPSAIEQYVHARAIGMCESRDCKRPIQHIHHVVPWAESRNHSPDNLAGLCRPCHSLVHSGAISNPRSEPRNWIVRPPDEVDPSTGIDRKVQAHRRPRMPLGQSRTPLTS